jgi:osmotically-inducible protein OsmY
MASGFSRGKGRLGGRSYGGYGSSGDYGYGARGEYAQSQFGGSGDPDSEAYWRKYFTPTEYQGRTAGEIGDRFVPEDANRDRQDTAHRMEGPSSSPGERRYHPGPKGYQRSDERIRDDAYQALLRRPDIDPTEVTIHVQDGKVLLEGTVPERRMRYDIEDLMAGRPHVREVDNQIRVAKPSR